MKIGYIRVSLNEQNWDLQMDALKERGVEKIFKEKMTGKRDDRPELQRCLDTLRKGDELVIYKLDRLGRSTFKLLELTKHFEEEGIDLISIMDGIDTSTPVGRFFFRTMASIAELERDIIAERTKAGLKSAKARGRVGGRPETPKKDLEIALRMYDCNEYSVPDIVERTGVSKATIYRAIKKRNEKTGGL